MHSYLNSIENKWPKKLQSDNFKIIIDADSSPVVHETIKVASLYKIPVYLVKDYAHYTTSDHGEHVTTLYVDTASDSADYKIAALIQENDIVVTGDYGLASIVLHKARAIHHTGFLYSAQNIDTLLLTRHIHHESRKRNKRVKGPSKFTKMDRKQFIKSLEQLIKA